MLEWVHGLNDQFFRFVTRGPVWGHVAAYLPLGCLVGAFLAWWSQRLVNRESAGTRRLTRGALAMIVVGTALLFPAFVLAVIHGNCQSLVEGGSIDWAQWRILYQQTLLALLVVATVVDFDQYLIPDQITVSGMAIGLVAATALGNLHLMPVWVDWNHADPIAGPYIPEWIKQSPHGHGLVFSLAGLLTGGGLTWLVRSISQAILGVEALGFGDVTLMAMIGSFVGWQPMLFVIFIAPMCGVLMGVSGRLLYGRRAIPFGPYLSAATLVVLLTWRWLWPPTRDLFGHAPTLAALGVLMACGLAVLLWLLRLYRSIPVARREE
ncbi:MAG: prepilin peptidase [Planctomycetales bacterium]